MFVFDGVTDWFFGIASWFLFRCYLLPVEHFLQYHDHFLRRLTTFMCVY
jgi:hypothetical protein